MAGSDKSSDVLSDYLKLLRRSPASPEIAASLLGTVLPPRAGQPCALILSPHPDDECLTGALPLRLRQEQGWQIVNLVVTLGSNMARRATRSTELAKACVILGFDCVLPQADAFSSITAATREANPAHWREMTQCLASIVAQLNPQAIFLPHMRDAHPTHIGTHLLGIDALAAQSRDFTCAVFQTEYWQPNENPNLMVGLTEKDAGTLLSALACHAGENARNPFDARFPAYLIDNVRRGSERVGGVGGASAALDFAMLYQTGLWRSGKYTPSALSRIIGPNESLGEILT